MAEVRDRSLELRGCGLEIADRTQKLGHRGIDSVSLYKS